MAHQTIYLDHAATTPVHPEVMPVMMPFFGYHFGNPHSIHSLGQQAHHALETARAQVAALIGAQPGEIVFTSGGTEADNLAILGAARALAHKGRHIITSAVEHHAALKTCAFLETQGYEVSYLGVDGNGRIDPAAVARIMRDDTILITIMHANNEAGTIQPIDEIGRMARERGILVHSDAVQSAGKIPVQVDDLHVDLLSISSHKLYGPKGVGALYVRAGTLISPQALGGGHERGLRSGTENMTGIVGFGVACAVAARDLGQNLMHVKDLRDTMEALILERLPWARVNGQAETRLPHILSITFEGLEAESIVVGLDAAGICASAGAACTAGNMEPSHVLTAMGISQHRAFATIRLSLGWENTETEIARCVDELERVVGRLKSFYDQAPHELGVITFPDRQAALRAHAVLEEKGLNAILAVTPGHLRSSGISFHAVYMAGQDLEEAGLLLESQRIVPAGKDRIRGVSKPMRGMDVQSQERAFWETLDAGNDQGDKNS